MVVVSDVLKDDRGEPIAFLYGHVREFDVASGAHVAAGELLAKSGGDPDDPGAGLSLRGPGARVLLTNGKHTKGSILR